MRSIGIAVVLVAVLAGVTTVRADLSDLPAQYEKVYGKEIKTEPGPKDGVVVREYEKNEIHVRVTFIGERAHHVRYFKPEGHFSLKEMQSILDANKGVSGEWSVIKVKEKQEPRLKGDGRHWRRNDNAEAFADFMKVGKEGGKHIVVKSVTIVTDQWLKNADKRF